MHRTCSTFRDTTDTLGIDANVNWSHVYLHQLLAVLGYHFTRFRTQVQPQFENSENISGNAGIFGNNQEPANWGPPALVFSSGIATLERRRKRVQSQSHRRFVSENFQLHMDAIPSPLAEIFAGRSSTSTPSRILAGHLRSPVRQSGGAASSTNGSDLADFLLGIPDTSALAYGNADKYFRQSVYDMYITDEWRAQPELTINAGMRWDYGVPLSELFGRLVNLDVVPGFTAVAPVLATDPVGPLTGMTYPNSLVRGDWRGFEPRIGIAWRPFPASTPGDPGRLWNL